jgi:hypothetical protein
MATIRPQQGGTGAGRDTRRTPRSGLSPHTCRARTPCRYGPERTMACRRPGEQVRSKSAASPPGKSSGQVLWASPLGKSHAAIKMCSRFCDDAHRQRSRISSLEGAGVPQLPPQMAADHERPRRLTTPPVDHHGLALAIANKRHHVSPITAGLALLAGSLVHCDPSRHSRLSTPCKTRDTNVSCRSTKSHAL